MKQRYGDIEFSQFDGAEMLAKKYGFDRAALDAWSLESHRRAARRDDGRALRRRDPAGARAAAGRQRRGRARVDEGIRFDASLESIGSVKLLREGGVLTAAQREPDLRRRVGRADRERARPSRRSAPHRSRASIT